jgi:hypothetical protein
VRKQVLLVLSVSNACNSCGMVLQPRHLSKAEKSSAILREIPALANLRSVCGDCANEFVVPQQAARSAFPAITRSDYVNLFSFKMDHRKCLLLSDLRDCHRKRVADALEQEAARKGTTARALWEQRHVPRRSRASVVDTVRAFFEEEDEDEAVQREQEQRAAEAKELLQQRIEWVPLSLVQEQPGEEWSPDSLETVARRNLQLLLQLGLVRIIKTEATRVGFVETLEEPVPAELAPLGLADTRAKKKSRVADDEDDYEDDRSSSADDEGRNQKKVDFFLKQKKKKTGSSVDVAVAVAVVAVASGGKRSYKKKGRLADSKEDFADEDFKSKQGGSKKKKGGENGTRKSTAAARTAASAKKSAEKKKLKVQFVLFGNVVFLKKKRNKIKGGAFWFSEGRGDGC